MISPDEADIHIEPIRGLPERPPEGERILWQGSPDWLRLAVEVFHLRLAILYCVAISSWILIEMRADGADVSTLAVAGAWALAASAAGCGLLALISWCAAKTTVYTITNQRVALRIGMALTLTVNLPFRKLASADLRRRPDGSGDIVFELEGDDRLAYLVLWPHARPWRWAKPQPAMRCLLDADRAADVLARAIAEPSRERAPARRPTHEEAPIEAAA